MNDSERGIVGEMDNTENKFSFEDEYDENEQKVIELLSMLSSSNYSFFLCFTLFFFQWIDSSLCLF